MYTDSHMELLLSYLPYVQIALAILLTIAILLQQRGAGLGGAFGGDEGTVHYERRGSERTMFRATITIAVIFVLSVFIPIIASDAPYIPPITPGVTSTSTSATTTSNIPNEDLETIPLDEETFSVDIERSETEDTDSPDQ